MMYPSEQKVTSEILWQAAAILAVIDIPFVTILTRRINREMFHQLKSDLVTITAFFWFLVWILMSAFFWEPVYHYVFPGWARWQIPPLYGVLFALVALLFWWLSFRFSGHPVLNFCVLGGLWGMVTHAWGITRGLIDKPPMLQGASPIAIVVMPIFEFIFYWCVILTLSAISHQRRHRTKHPKL